MPIVVVFLIFFIALMLSLGMLDNGEHYFLVLAHHKVVAGAILLGLSVVIVSTLQLAAIIVRFVQRSWPRTK